MHLKNQLNFTAKNSTSCYSIVGRTILCDSGCLVALTMCLNEQCCSLVFQQCDKMNNVVHYCFNNVVERTMLFTIISTMLWKEQCCSLLFQQCCLKNNVVHCCFNNIVERTMLFTIVSTMLFNEQCWSLLFQQCWWTNNVVHYCFNNVVQRTMLFTIVSTMLFSVDEETTVVHGCWNRRQQYWQNNLVRCCYHCRSTLLRLSCNSWTLL